MKYFITNIAIACDDAGLTDPVSDILKTYLAEIGYEAFEDDSEKAMEESGILSGGFPAGAAGICAAILFGYLAALIFRPREK